MYDYGSDISGGGRFSDVPLNLDRLTHLDDWQLAEGEPDITGWNLVDMDNNTIGKIDDLLVNTDTCEVLFAILSHGGFLGIGATKTLIPLTQIQLNIEDRNVILLVTPDHISHAPKFDEDSKDYGLFVDYWGLDKSILSGRMMEEEPVEAIKGGSMEPTGQTCRIIRYPSDVTTLRM